MYGYAVMGTRFVVWSGTIFWFGEVRVFALLALASWLLKFASTPGPFGGRGDTPRWGLMAGSAACCAQFFRYSPFFPVQSQQTELLATTEERWRRRHLSPGHKAGPLLFFFLTRVQGVCFKPRALLSVESGHSPQGDQPKYWRVDQPKDWRAPSQKLEGRRYVFNRGGGASEVVLVRRWLRSSIVSVAGTPFHRSLVSFFPRLSRFLRVLHEHRLAYFFLSPHSAGVSDSYL